VKIGIPCAGFIGWAGGIDLLRVAIESLVALEERGLEIHVIIPDHGPVLFVRNAIGNLRATFNSQFRGESHARPQGLSAQFIADSLGETRIAAHFHHIDMGRASLAAALPETSTRRARPLGISIGRELSDPLDWIYRRLSIQVFPTVF